MSIDSTALIITDDMSPSEMSIMQRILPEQVLKASMKIEGEYLSIDGKELDSLAEPNHEDRKVKKMFWKTYNHCLKAEKRISIRDTVAGIMKRQTFTTRFINNPARLTWLLSPITPYKIEIETLLDQAVDRYKELIDMEITTTKKIKYKDADGNDQVKFVKEVDAKKAMVLLSVIKNLEERTHGSAVQRQVSVKAQAPDSRDESVELDMGKVNDRLKELEGKLGHDKDIIEV